MKKYLILISCIIFSIPAPSQELNLLTGFSVNQTRFLQDAPTIMFEFENPRKPGYGLEYFLGFTLIYDNHIEVKFRPFISFYNTRSNVADSYSVDTYGASLSLGYSHENVGLRIGARYSYLKDFEGEFQNNITNWTFFVNRRHYFSPQIAISYHPVSNLHIFIESTYFIKDMIDSGAFDNMGGIIGPIHLTPLIFSIGVEFHFKRKVKDANTR